MRVAIGSDHAGVELRQEIIEMMQEMGMEVFDAGCECSTSVDYPDSRFLWLKW